MNIRTDIKELKTDAKTLRKFGLVVGGVFALLGLVLLHKHRPSAPYFLGVGGFLVVAGLIVPRGLRLIYLAWMALAVVLGFVVSHVLLTLFFYLILTPVGLVARIFGNDFLGLKLDAAAKSYWLPRDQKKKTAADYERQF